MYNEGENRPIVKKGLKYAIRQPNPAILKMHAPLVANPTSTVPKNDFK
jgi:hypothetical protein